MGPPSSLACQNDVRPRPDAPPRAASTPGDASAPAPPAMPPAGSATAEEARAAEPVWRGQWAVLKYI